MSALQPVVGYRSEAVADSEWNDDVVAGPPASAGRGQLERYGYLYVVANGLGPHGSGRGVARLAVETIVVQYYALSDLDVRERLEMAMKGANEAAFAAARQGPTGMGSAVVTCCVVRGDELWVGHVGDCRAYIVRRDSIQQLTRDHVASHASISPGSAGHTETDRPARPGGGGRPAAGERRLTRVLGLQATVDVDVLTERIRSGDRVLLCSRGLASALANEEMLGRVRQLGPRRAPDDLVALAMGRGGGSALTALVISAPGAPSPGIMLPDRSPRSSAVSIEPAMPVIPTAVDRSRARRRRVPRSALLLAAAAVALAIMAPRLSESAVGLAPQVGAAAATMAHAASSAADGLVSRFGAFDISAWREGATSPDVFAAAPLATSTDDPAAPAQTATAIMLMAQLQRETAEAESTRIVAAAAVEATEGVAALQASMGEATAQHATAVAAATAGAAAPEPALFPPVRSLVLTQPVKDVGASGKVVFDWAWSGTLRTGQAFDVRVCRDPGCVPSQGKGLPVQSPWWWCPDGGPGIYRWQVVLVEGESMASVGPVSDVGQFIWMGGEPCIFASPAPTEDEADEPSPEPTKEKAPPPLAPSEAGP